VRRHRPCVVRMNPNLLQPVPRRSHDAHLLQRADSGAGAVSRDGVTVAARVSVDAVESGTYGAVRFFLRIGVFRVAPPAPAQGVPPRDFGERIRAGSVPVAWLKRTAINEDSSHQDPRISAANEHQPAPTRPAHLTHNREVAGSSPAPATKQKPRSAGVFAFSLAVCRSRNLAFGPVLGRYSSGEATATVCVAHSTGWQRSLQPTLAEHWGGFRVECPDERASDLQRSGRRRSGGAEAIPIDADVEPLSEVPLKFELLTQPASLKAGQGTCSVSDGVAKLDENDEILIFPPPVNRDIEGAA
jgi:hypothetical protein